MIVLYLMAAAALYVLPGWALVTYLFKESKLSFWEKLGISAGISVAIYPLLFLWLYTLGIRAGPWCGWVMASAGLLALLWKFRQNRGHRPIKIDPPQKLEPRLGTLNVLILVTVGLIVFTRFAVIRDMTAPAWGDSVHHTMIVKLMQENGGLFQSWEPYAPVQSFTYHFGFHSSTAVWSWMTGVDTDQATLIVGQILNVLAVLALFSLVTRLTRNRWAGLASLIVAGLIFPYPGFYVNWGRYTQLTAQVILPALVVLFDLLWSEEKRPKLGIYILMSILLSGLALTHYRVAFVAVAAALSWAGWGLWQLRKKFSEWVNRVLSFCGVGIASCLVILPWFLSVRESQLFAMFNRVREPQWSRDFWVWTKIDSFFSSWFMLLGGAALVLAFIFRRRLAFPAAGWCLAAFFMTNPFLLGLPGSHWIENPILLYGIYIPLGIFLGWGFGWMMEKAARKRAEGFVSLLLILVCIGWGMNRQLHIVDPFFQMMTAADKAAFVWIKENIPEDSRFIVNGFLVSDGDMVMGSDGGWWLPYYTQRASVLLPAIHRVEALDLSYDREAVVGLYREIEDNEGEVSRLGPLLSESGITHIYLGEKRGRVGYGAQELIPEEWLSDNPDFTLLFQEGKAQVWRLKARIKE